MAINFDKRKLPRKILLPIVLLALGVGGVVLLVASKSKPAPVQAQEQSWVVAVQSALPQAVAPTLALFGRVESPRAAKLTAALSADVRAVPVREGLTVQSGQLLVQLDDREARLAVARRRAELAQIEALVDSEIQRHESDLAALAHERTLLDLNEKALLRARDLRTKNLASQAAVEEAQQAVERQFLALQTRSLAVNDHPARQAELQARRARAQAELELARLDLSRTRVSAPYAGRVARVAVAPGDRVTVGAVLVEMYDTQALEVRAQIPAAHVATLQRTLDEQVLVSGSGRVEGATIALTLDRLGGQVGLGSGGMDGLFGVVEGAAGLTLGAFVDLVIQLPPVADVVALPYAALYGVDRIYVMREGRMRGVQVTVMGEQRSADGSARALVQGAELQAGDAVIITQLPNAVDGLKVTTPES